MKVSKAQAAENRQGILDAAARLYRERGLSGVGVADITRDAGLTHGGLYRHFASKDALVREACAQAFDWSIAPLEGAQDATDLASRVKSYLSSTHRDHPGKAALQRHWPWMPPGPAATSPRCLPRASNATSTASPG